MSKRSEEPSSERWFDDGCILDMDYFVKTISGIKSRGVRPDLLGSIITHYAFKWLPELSSSSSFAAASAAALPTEGNPQSVTGSWMKKRFVVETLIGVLPSEKEAVPCGFLLRLLRTASMVGVEAGVQSELERRAARQLDEASLEDLMIPSFAHTSAVLLDVSLVLRLVAHFSGDENAVIKVAKLVDSYLAEAAVDANLTVSDFIVLASALPCHSRALHDGLYRAIDTYLKAHPRLAKQERKSLCRLIESRKLSPEAALHAAHNDRLPVRAVIQVLFSKNNTAAPSLSADWSGSFTATRRHDTEVRRLRDDLLRLQAQFEAMKAHIEIIVHHNNNMTRKQSKKNKMTKNQSPSSALGFFRWKKFGFVRSSVKSTSTVATATTMNKVAHEDSVVETPLNVNMKTRLVRGPPKWRRSIS